MNDRNRSRHRAPRTIKASTSNASVWIYGLHAVAAALDNPRRKPIDLRVTRNAEQSLAASVTLPDCRHAASPDQIAKLLPDGAVHQGCALQAEPLDQPDLEDLLEQAGSKALFVVLDQVTDPHNVGAILRSSAAFGGAGVIVHQRHSPGETGTLVKAASGAFELVSYVRVPNLARALENLAQHDFEIVGLADDAPDVLEHVAPDGPCALVLGAEGPGLRHLTRQKCTRLVRLPTRPAMPSLNVSNAAAVALYALARKETA